MSTSRLSLMRRMPELSWKRRSSQESGSLDEPVVVLQVLPPCEQVCLAPISGHRTVSYPYVSKFRNNFTHKLLPTLYNERMA